MDTDSVGLKSLRIFLSYTISEKELAGELKKYLERFGFDVFLAHEDIQPTVEWQDDILRNLDMADIFVAVLTKDFRNSDWTDQETGVAVAGQKFIVPLQVNQTPYGFINKYQSLKLKNKFTNPAEVAANEILEAIVKRSKFKTAMKSFLINSLSESPSFDDGKIRAKALINYFSDFTADEVKRLYTISVENNQVNESWGAQSALRYFFNNHKEVLTEEEFNSVTEKLK
jgi:hypothetical protein